MLRVTFHQFRCWQDLVIEAPIGGITLVKGSSGVGKTTILQGITWCLYGNTRLVAPNHLEKAKTRVIVDLPYTLSGVRDNLSINRQRNPNRLVLTHGGKVYEDKIAQAIIDDSFGNYDIWLASCYIGQGCRNSFLTAPNTGKMELLNSIAFHEEDPSTFIERIDSHITDVNSEYNGKLALFNNNLATLQNMLAGLDMTKALIPEQASLVNQKLAALTQELHQLEAQKVQRDVDSGVAENLRLQLSKAMSTVIKPSEPSAALIAMNTKYEGKTMESLDHVDSNIQRALDCIPMLQRRNDLDVEVKRIDTLLLPYVNFASEIRADTPHYSMSDYQEALSKENACHESQRLAQSLGVLYSEASIRQVVENNQQILESQERLRLEQDRRSLSARITQLEQEQQQQNVPLVAPEIVPQTINPPDYARYNRESFSRELAELSKKQGTIQAHIQHLQRGHDVLHCPHCRGTVRYQQGSLTAADTGPPSRDEMNKANEQLLAVHAEITRVNTQIQSMAAEEMAARSNYEKAVMTEQRRVDSLRETHRQIELEKQRRDIAKSSRAQQIEEHRNNLRLLEEKIAPLPEITPGARVLSQKDIEQTHSLIARLSNLKILSYPPVSSQYIQSCMTYQDLMRRSAAATVNHNNYVETIPLVFRNESVRNIQIYLEELRNYLGGMREWAAERSRLDHLRVSLDQQIGAVLAKMGADPLPEINRIKGEIGELQECLVLSEKAHKGIQYHKQVSEEREQVVSLNENVSDLQVLRQHAVDTECRILQQVVDSINASIDSVCGTLFERDISINLSLFKTLKTSKNVKPVVNFTIAYNGGTFENISQMSGGEGDRASLALTLALNRLSGCPILMLDESLASLDLNMKEAAIRTIRENTNNTVLVILHDGIEGIFDCVVDVDNIRESHPLA